MPHSFNRLDPMSNSMYWEYDYPGTIDEVVKYYDNMPAANPNGPKLKPQLTKDSWYYSKDNADDGHISPFEKLKAFVKGGTYNMIRGLFCDKDGFSFGRTLTSAVAITAIALSGPIGAAIAGGLGIIAAVDNFAQSTKLAKNAVSDQQAREAYEGFGESTSTAGLSIFGGFKGFQAIKNNFAWVKANPNMKVPFFDNFTKWNVSKTAVPKPIKEEPPAETPVVEEPVAETPAETPVAETPVKTPISETPVETPILEEPAPEAPVKKTTRARKKTASPNTTRKTKKSKIPNLKGVDYKNNTYDTTIPQGVKVVPDSTPLGEYPSPIGSPNNDMWY